MERPQAQSFTSAYTRLSPAGLAYAEELARGRQHQAEEFNRPDMRRDRRMSDLEMHRQGARGEVVVAIHYGAPMPRLDLAELRDDELGDVGGCEVKAHRRCRGWEPCLWLSPPPSWKKELDRPVVAVNVDAERFLILGWSWTYEARVPEYWFPAREQWRVPAHLLHDPATLPIEVSA